jgi:hypothetical protein
MPQSHVRHLESFDFLVKLGCTSIRGLTGVIRDILSRAVRCQGAGIFADGNFLISRIHPWDFGSATPIPPRLISKKSPVPTKRAKKKKKEFVEKNGSNSAALGYPGTALALNALRQIERYSN